MLKYDYLVVGSGLFGSVFAHEMDKNGKKVLVIEKRDHIGGNVYTEEISEINVLMYLNNSSMFCLPIAIKITLHIIIYRFTIKEIIF